MTKHEYIVSKCRYYKGEKECPFEDENKSLWFYESKWVEMKENHENVLSEYIEYYIKSGLVEFEEMDATPLSLKALLWNRFEHWTGGCQEDFKVWYKKYYKGGQIHPHPSSLEIYLLTLICL